MTKLLFFQWNSFMNRGIEKGLKELGIEYDTCYYQLTDWEEDEKFLTWFEEIFKNRSYENVFSVNFVPMISEVCEQKGIRYLSWIYDSPVHFRNLESMKRSCCRVYHFDRGQVEAYRKQGITIQHLPLAVDSEVFLPNPSAQEDAAYNSPVSFVGKLYQTEYAYYTTPLNEHARGYLEGLIKAQGKVYGGYFLDEMITDTLLEELNQDYERVSAGEFQMGKRELEFLLASEITGRERRVALTLLGKYYPVYLYSGDGENIPANVIAKGYADYYSKMPMVFLNSKVNLNISLKTIRSGIPLRVLDVMGCGGFLLSNYQAEMEEYFQIGREMDIYENMEDLVFKTRFYLEHDDVRKQMVQRGVERMKRDFTFRERMKSILSEK